MVSFVLTVLGDDRPGLVDSLAAAVAAHGGNWERSQMARLGGKFAGVVQVNVPNAAAAALQAELATLSDGGLLQVRIDPAGAAPDAPGARFVLSLVGTDRPGLVHSVSSALAEIAVVLPVGVTVSAVRSRLEALADRLMVDIDVVS